MTVRIAIAGHVTHDRYGDAIVAGGCAYYGAWTHRGLSAKVRLHTTVGLDFACDDALAGFDTVVERAGKTTLFTNTYPEGGIRIQRIEAMAPKVRPPQRIEGVDLVHLAPVMQDVDLAAWLAAAPDGLPVALAIQGWIKDTGPNETVVQTPWQVDGALLARLAAVAVGEEDLVDQGDLLDHLCRHVPIVAFTHGKRGCDIIERGKTTKVGVYATEQVDPTGAGDTFAAGFFLGLAEGAGPIDAARLGAAAASIVVEGQGGATLPRIGEARERARAIR